MVLSPTAVFGSYIQRASQQQHRFLPFDLALRVGLLVKGVFATLAALFANLFDLTTHLQPPPPLPPQPSPGMTDFVRKILPTLRKSGFLDPNLEQSLLRSFIEFRDTGRPCGFATVKTFGEALPRSEASILANFFGYTLREESQTVGDGWGTATTTFYNVYTPITQPVPEPARQ